MITGELLRNITQSLSRLQKLQTQLASNKSILEASDDPVGASMAVALRAALAAREQYQKNGLSARDRLSASEDALTSIQSLLTTVQGLAVRGADETGGLEARRDLADQVNQSLEQLSDLSGSHFGEEYIFGGTEITSAPYTATRNGSRPTTLTGFNAATSPATALNAAGLPGTITSGGFTVSIYNASGTLTSSTAIAVTAGATTLNDLATALGGLGLTATVGADNRLSIAAGAGGSLTLTGDTSGTLDALGLNTFGAGEISVMAANPRGVDGLQIREIQEGVTMAANVTGTEVFSQSVNLFQSLLTLRDALRANSTTAISGSLANLKVGLGQVSAAIGSVGSRIQRVDAVQEILAADLTRVKGYLSRIEDADIAATTLDYQQQQTLYQASLQMGARLIQPSLLDFLR
jgi:flagellar hook-associated protein 3 FlgL